MEFNQIKRTSIVLGILVSIGLLFSFAPPAFSDEEEPSLREKKTQEGYIFNLKDLIKESKTKIEKVDDKLQEQARLRRNQQREEKAREYYERAMRLYDEGKYEEAQDFWRKAVKITEHPEMKDYINESVRKGKNLESAFKNQEQERIRRLESERGYSAGEVEKVYQTAVSLYRQKKYLAAKDEFEKVDEMFPDHKATRSYLMLIARDIEKDQEDLIEKKVKEEAAALKKEKEDWKNSLETKEKEQDIKSKEQAEVAYRDAVELFNAKDYSAAREKFQNVDWVLPDYKETARYLAKIDVALRSKEKDIEDKERKRRLEEEDQARRAQREQEEREAKRKRQENEEQLKRVNDEAQFAYDAAMSLYAKRLYLQAKDKFLEVEKISPEFKSTKQYLAKIEKDISAENQRLEEERRKVLEQKQKEDDLAKQKEDERKRKERELAEKQRQDKLLAEAEALYQEAVNDYKLKDYKSAKTKFERLQNVYLGYKSVVKYLSRIDIDIAKEEKRQISEKQKAIEERQRQEIREKAQKVEEERIARKKQEDGKALEKEQEAQRKKEEKEARLAKEKEERANRLKEKEEADKKRQEELETARQQKEQDKIAQDKEKQFMAEVNHSYKEAISLYKQKRYDEAKTKFEELQGLAGDYKETKTYLRRIDDDVFAQKEKQAKAVLVSEKNNTEVKTEVKQNPEPIENLDQNKEEERLAKQKEKEDRERQKAARKEAEEIYQAAIRHYKNKEFDEAKTRFEQVISILPEYKQTQKYLSRIEEDKADYERKTQEAQDTFSMQVKKQKETKQPEGPANNAEDPTLSMLSDAMQAYKNKDYSQAKKAFQDILDIEPGHSQASKYLKRSEDLLARQEAQRVRQEEQAKRRQEKLEEKERQQEEQKAKAATKKDKEQSAKVVSDAVLEQATSPTLHTSESSDEFVRQAEIDRRKRIAKEAEEKYAQAMRLFKSKEYLQAKVKFVEVEMISPNYKSTLSMLGQIEDLATQEIDSSGQEKIEIVIPQQDSPSEAREVTKEIRVPVIPSQEDQDKMPTDDRWEPGYQEAVNLYNNKQYVLSKEKFDELKENAGEYKSISVYQQRLDTIIKEEVKALLLPPIKVEQKQAPDERVYDRSICDETEGDFKDAVALYKEGRLVEAKMKFLSINQKTPCRKEITRYLVMIDKKLYAQSLAKLKELEAQKVNEKNLYSSLTGSSDQKEWEAGLQQKDVLLKLKRDQLKNLEGERYKALKERMSHDRAIEEQIAIDRRRKDAQRKRLLRQEFLLESQLRKEEEREQALAEEQKRKEDEARLKEEELAKKKEDELRLKEEQRVKLEEEKKAREEALAKKREEERLAREERQRQIEEERRRKQEEIAKRKEEAEKKRQEALAAKEEEKRQKEEALAKQKEEEAQAIEDKNREEAELKAQEKLAREEKLRKIKEGKLLSLDENASPQDKLLTQYDYQQYKNRLNKKDAKDYLDRVRKQRDHLKSKISKDLARHRKEIEAQKERKETLDRSHHEDQIDEVYKEALALYQEKRYEAARAKFAMVEGMWPDYKMAKGYISDIDAIMAGEKDRLKDEKERLARLETEKAREEEEKKRLAEEKKLEEEARLKAVEDKKKIKEDVEQKKAEALAARQKLKEEQQKQRLEEAKRRAEEKQKAKEDAENKRQEELAAKEKEKQDRLEAQQKAKEEHEQKEKEELLAKEKAKEATLEEKALAEKQKEKELSQKEILAEHQTKIKESQDEAAKISEDAQRERLKRHEEQEKEVRQAKKKNEIEAAKKKQAEEKSKLAQTKKLEKDINKRFKAVEESIKDKNFETAKQGLTDIEGLLTNTSLSEDYVGKVKDRIDKNRGRIAQVKNVEDAKHQEVAAKREEEMARLKEEREEKDRASLSQLEKKIQISEERLAKERKIMEARLARERQREEDRVAQDKRLEEEREEKERVRKERLALKAVEQEGIPASPETETNNYRQEKEQEQAELADAKRKQADLERERARIKKEFEERLAKLYKRGIELYQNGIFEDAEKIFREIDSMSPGYQKIEDYLRKIGKKNPSLVAAPVPEVPPTNTPPQQIRQDAIEQTLDAVEKKL